MSGDLDTRPVGLAELTDLAELFRSARTTCHCWCTLFCTTRTRFALGWFGGGNRRRFEALTADSATPMGVLASIDGEPLGWAACGPRARYVVATDPGNALTSVMRRAEDETAWLIPCLFVRADHRSQGITSALVRAAVDLAAQHGATAVEGWPVTDAGASPGAEFVGRETVFTDLGFTVLDRPAPHRAIMRRALSAL